MNRLHPYIAALLLAAWWLLRERWDSVTFAAVDLPPWWAWVLLAGVVVPWVPTIRGVVASVWQRVRTNMPTEANPWSLSAIVAGVVIGVLIGWFAARVDFTPSPQPKPDVPVVAPDEPVKVSRVTYVYEKDDGSVPSGVQVALSKLNKDGVPATSFEDDSKNGGGNVPAQYKVAADAAAGNAPCLVVERGNTVKVHPKVTTEAQVLEAVR